MCFSSNAACARVFWYSRRARNKACSCAVGGGRRRSDPAPAALSPLAPTAGAITEEASESAALSSTMLALPCDNDIDIDTPSSAAPSRATVSGSGVSAAAPGLVEILNGGRTSLAAGPAVLGAGAGLAPNAPWAVRGTSGSTVLCLCDGLWC